MPEPESDLPSVDQLVADVVKGLFRSSQQQGSQVMAEPVLSIVSNAALEYPGAEEYYSPYEKYPEYRHGHLAKKPNQVYAAVRDVFAQADLDGKRFNTPDWNPLGAFIPPRSRVFLLCNFVCHRRPTESRQAFQSKCTHASVLRAVLDYVLIAVGRGVTVRFGNAPLQSCNWEKVIEETGASRVLDFYAHQNVPVEACDLRLFVCQQDMLGAISRVEHRRASEPPPETYFGNESLLAELDAANPRFRVTDYDPKRTEACQAAGQHIYLPSRSILESDVIFSVPKLKTHEKVGLTCGLKGLVGAIALKDCLAHHRFGPPNEGGDEYPQRSTGLRLLSKFEDWVCSQNGRGHGLNVLRMLDRNARRLVVRAGGVIAGAWHGNDTAWRMTLDIARILTYADADGSLKDRPQRRHLLLVDGIVGGEGDGPLAPRPVKSGLLLFSSDLAQGDQACCRLIGFDPEKVPLVREAFRVKTYPIASVKPDSSPVFFNGRVVSLAELRPLPRTFLPPRGWRGHVELRRA